MAAEAAWAEPSRAGRAGRQAVAAVKPQQLPGGAHHTGEISNHESFTPALLSPSLLLQSHAAVTPGQAACLPLSASLMNDYCIS